MSGWLLDTNVISEARKGERADASLARWLDGQDPRQHFISVITVMEIEIGIHSLQRRDARQGSVLRNWLERSVLPAFDQRILPVSLEVARRCAALHVPDRRPERDALIAATALVYGLVVATRNTRDYLHTEARLFDPWQSAHD